MAVPSQDFIEQQEEPDRESIVLTFVPQGPTSRSQFEARQLIEGLRFGVAPVQFVRELTIGLEKERASLVMGLNQAHKSGGAVRAVIGDYGFGKSHVVEWTTQEALARNFVVATTRLDLVELPPHHAFEIYSSLIRNLRYPDSEQRGVTHLLKKASKIKNIVKKYCRLTPVESDSLALVLDTFQNTTSQRQHKRGAEWLEGGSRVNWMNSWLPRGAKFPTIYKIGHNVRQIGYLLGGMSALARLANYSGLCILIDEAESYSLLRRRERPKADLFFKAMIYAALRDQQDKIQPDSLPQQPYRDYPAAFDKQQSLFFLFTVTHSQHNLPLDQWLNNAQILNLNAHHNPSQINIFLKQVMHYHSQAYDYQPGIRHRQVTRAAAEYLARGMHHKRINVRGLVRLAVELFDLLYLHDDFDIVKFLSELRKQMSGGMKR